MNISRNFKVIGITSQVIGIIITYTLIIGTVFFWFKDISKKFGVIENLLLIPIILMIYFLGSFNYELFWKYKSYIQGNIEQRIIIFSWYKSLISTSSIIVFSLFISITEKEVGYLTTILLLMPQIILLIIVSPNNNQSISDKPKIKFKPKRMIKLPQNLNPKEVYVISLIVGAISCITLGYLFGQTQYFTGSGKRVFVETEHTIRKFNYITGIISFIISSGISYLVLNKAYNK